jgi:hypothetical protein
MMDKKDIPDTADVQKIAAVADFIIADGTNNTSGGNWITDFGDVPSDIAEPDFVKSNSDAIADELAGREEVLDIETDGGNFDIVYGLAFCPNLENEEDAALYEQAQQEKGYVIAVCDDSDFYIPNAEHIERNDSASPWKYKNDAEAAKGAEQDGVKLIYGMTGVKNGIYIDNPANRKLIETVLHKEKQQERKPSVLETLKMNAEKSRQQFGEPKKATHKNNGMEM